MAPQKPLLIKLALLLTLVFPLAALAEDQIREFVVNEFRYSGGTLVCYTDNKDAEIDTPCLHIGDLTLGLSMKDTVDRITAHGGKFYKRVEQANQPDIYIYTLPTPKSEKSGSYLAITYKEGKTDVLQLTGTKTEAPLAFSSIHLGDSQARLLELLGPPSAQEALTDMPGFVWSYRPYPFSIEVVKEKVYSIHIRSEEKPMPAIAVDKAVGQVTDYMTKVEYPERFGKTDYRVRVNDIVSLDYFGDGNRLVFLATYPHYLQSPSIVLFKVDKAGIVTRVTEGLAPGPLQPLSGDYLDSHMLKPKKTAQSMDMVVGENLDKFIKALIEDKDSPAHVVRYPKFIHVDFRAGKGGYLDMSDRLEFKDEKTCAGFEFSKVDSIRVGKLKGEKGNRMAALVGGEIYLYDIQSISPDGFLKKTMRVIPKPKDFKEFNSDPGAVMSYETKAGKTKELSLTK